MQFPLRLSVVILLMSSAIAGLSSGQAPSEDVPMVVDGEGVMRWADSGQEVALFGVNYNTPFAYGYRAHGYVGSDRKQAIDADVHHLVRLGLDAFRIHVWDREISDRDGNVIDNDHLDLLDYLLSRLHAAGIKTVLTPIAWWPSGYPEPPPRTAGFSDPFSKGQMSTDPDARPAQENYLKQFISRANRYSGRAYREDPDVLAIEIFNEPNHPGGAEATTAYVDAMAAALRAAGLRKPIFYNISEGYSDPRGEAVCAARIHGVTAQWYPSGLVRGNTIRANMLPNVDRYAIPFDDFPACQNKARLVYEFDAADVGGSHMYPAMARAFRGAGFQWATQFAYDPLAIAYSNTEYQTHFLNLVYTPARAISFMIAGHVFRSIPRGASFGTYPESERFGAFRVSFEEDLSEMVTDTVFFYSNHTATTPPDPGALRRVAGVGSSPVVSYEGRGAYFLDRIERGVWRLEVYPDASVVKDPFGRPSLQRHAVRLVSYERAMRVTLPDLGGSFTVEPLDEGNAHRPAVEDGSFSVQPGVYLLAVAEAEAGARAAADAALGDRLGAFYVPPLIPAPADVDHEPPAEAVAGEPFVVRADVVSTHPVDSAAVFVRRLGRPGGLRRIRLEPVGGSSYEAQVPEALLQPGLISYMITVYENGEARTHPDRLAGHPYLWDFTGEESWTVPVVGQDVPIVLFDTRRDLSQMLAPYSREYVSFALDVVGGTMPDRLALRVMVHDLSPAPHFFGLRTFMTDGQRVRLGRAGSDGALRIRARATNGDTRRMEIALVERNGAAWGAVIPLSETWEDVEVPLATLRRVPLHLVPRPYPPFHPYTLMAAVDTDRPDLASLEGVQFSIGTDHVERADRSHGFEIEHVLLISGER